MDSNLQDWLADASRVEGDTNVIPSADENGTYVVCFLSRDNNEYPTVNIRHILVKASSDASDEEKAAAKETAQGYLDEFLDSDQTEDDFADLAEKYSEDTGSASNGGLYEDVQKGQMVKPFEEWCFDASRKPGDSGIVETDYGYHVMYFSGEGKTARQAMVTNKMLSNYQDDWLKELTEDYTFEINEKGMSYTSKNRTDTY